MRWNGTSGAKFLDRRVIFFGAAIFFVKIP